MNRRNPAGRLRAGLRDPSPPLTLPGNRSSVEGKPPGKWGDMERQGATSLLRRIGSSAVLLCLAFSATAQAASPSPDPPPLGVAPEAPEPKPAAPRAPAPRPAVAQTRTVVTQAPVVVRTVEQPVYVVREVPAKPAAAPKTPARAKPVAKATAKPKPKPAPAPKRRAVLPQAPPHDRGPVPLAALIPSVEELDRGLVAVAGAALAFVALGGAVVLLAARRQLGVAR